MQFELERYSRGCATQMGHVTEWMRCASRGTVQRTVNRIGRQGIGHGHEPHSKTKAKECERAAKKRRNANENNINKIKADIFGALSSGKAANWDENRDEEGKGRR